jgi:tRNA(Ile)-lysidine synthase
MQLELHVAHLHHGIRGPEADADLEFVTELARVASLPFTAESVDVPQLATRAKLAVEEAARRARYAFLTRVAQQINAQNVAVGHNADDQAETVLMHLLRGAGPAGLRGMLPATRMRDYRLLPQAEGLPVELTLIRPLLNTPRADIEAYCRAEGLQARFDRSNLDTTYFRNRLRHEVLPYLAQINPRISERLRSLAEVVRADYALLNEFVTVAQDTLLVASHPDAVIFDLPRWREQPIAIRRALIRRSAYQLRRMMRDIAFDHVENALELVQRGDTGAQAILPHGVCVTVGYTTLVIAHSGALHLPIERPWLEPATEMAVAVPGVTVLPNGWALHATEHAEWDSTQITANPNPLIAWLDQDALQDQPVLRTRRKGDRFQPQGMEGSDVRLSDFLINTKLPRPWRDHLPLLVSNERLLWVVGLRLSQAALVNDGTRRVVQFRLVGPQKLTGRCE